jgi:hypothetical protein
MIKNILLAVFFLCSFTGRAQIFHSSLSTQEWAGGICCKGIQYTLFITGDSVALEKLVVKAVCVDGKYFDQVTTSPLIARNRLFGRTYTFNLRTDPDDHLADCNNNGRIYLEGREFLMIESRHELPFIAYP